MDMYAALSQFLYRTRTSHELGKFMRFIIDLVFLGMSWVATDARSAVPLESRS